jgi:DNA-binding transcriptional LysR family regulator
MNNYDNFDLVVRCMDLSDLKIFRAVAREGGITRAAERLHRVQSNVTTRVRQLEEELGVQLFIRSGKRLHIAPAGHVLLGYADRLLDLAQEARDAVQDVRPRGLFRLGAMESTAAVRLPAPLSEFHRRYPEVTLELRTGNPQQLATAILAGELDAALAAEPLPDAPFDKVAVYQEDLVIIAAAGHPPITAQADPPKTIVAFEQGCPHRKRLEDWFARRGSMPERTVEMSSYHAMLGCIVVGMGVSLLPRSVLTTFPESKRLSVHALPKGQDRAQTVLFWRKGASSPKIDALVEVLTAQRDQGRSSKAKT